MTLVNCGILGVHALLTYEDDTGYGMTFCGLSVFPFDVESSRPLNCVVCQSRDSQGPVIREDK